MIAMSNLTKVFVIFDYGTTNVANVGPTRARHFVASRFLDKLVAALGTRSNLGIRNGFFYA